MKTFATDLAIVVITASVLVLEADHIAGTWRALALGMTAAAIWGAAEFRYSPRA